MNAQSNKPLKSSFTKESLEVEQLSYSKQYRFYYIAAAIMISSILIYQFLEEKPDAQDLYVSYYQAFPVNIDINELNASSDSLIFHGFNAYKDGKYTKASSLFEASLKHRYDEDIAFYLAMSYINSNNETQDLSMFKKLKQKQSKYMPQLYWYTALLYLKANDSKAAIKQLDSLRLTKSNFKKQASRKILKTLKS
ncbi:hypothetical protein [Dokdonia sp. Hel_I_53]|uniref:hypothetical protein n=1 Tax=Dokdonia sp. Hel_I_53 TaxID=1566287 RepID=UPI00119AF4B9|nr:hypothetical protein [Dokdonia sp. Hel_I_53]TVZ52842.1 hypothetical protein OD90_2026 [Dokdonia sp. Hel_I_53]